MKQFNRERGRYAESLAAAMLTRKGYEILEQNFSNKFGEIDIIASDHDVIVFVEVKAKTGEQFGNPEEMISPSKLRRVKNTALMYLSGRQPQCRIDVIAIVLSPTREVIRMTHYENVF